MREKERGETYSSLALLSPPPSSTFHSTVTQTSPPLIMETYTLNETVVYKKLEPFIPLCNIEEFIQLLKRTKTIITQHFALSLVFAVEPPIEDGICVDALSTCRPKLRLEVPTRFRIVFTRWMTEMQTEETEHSCQDNLSSYKFKGPDKMQDFECKYVDDDSKSIRLHLNYEASAFQCYFEGE